MSRHEIANPDGYGNRNQLSGSPLPRDVFIAGACIAGTALNTYTTEKGFSIPGFLSVVAAVVGQAASTEPIVESIYTRASNAIDVIRNVKADSLFFSSSLVGAEVAWGQIAAETRPSLWPLAAAGAAAVVTHFTSSRREQRFRDVRQDVHSNGLSFSQSI